MTMSRQASQRWPRSRPGTSPLLIALPVQVDESNAAQVKVDLLAALRQVTDAAKAADTASLWREVRRFEAL